MIKKIFYTALMAFFSQFVSAQELWQLTPWAADSNYVMGAMASGEPTWVHKDSLGITGGGAGTVKGDGATNKVAYWASSDSLTNESTFSYLPTSDILGIGIATPTGLGVGLHLNGGTFTDFHLTNSTTGTTSSDGTSIFINASDVYLTNRENGDITLATQNIERIKINETGTVNVSSLDTDNAAPTTSGTTRKVITDANGLLSFKTDTDGTVTSVGFNTGTSGTDVSVSGSPVTGSGTITLNIPTASGTNTGKLSSTDWTTFNNKLGSLNGLTNSTQTFALSRTGNDLSITSSGSTHTFSLPFDGNDNGIRLGKNSVRRDNSVALGANALQSSGSSASNCIAIGKDVLRLAGSTGSGGTNNVGMGFQALYALTTGIDNFGLGTYALANLTTGAQNVCIGTIAGLSLTTTSNNVMIGYEAGRFNTGSGSVFIGNQAGRSETNGNRLYITNTDDSSPLIGGDFSTNKVGINTAPGSIVRDLHVTGEARITDLVTDNPTFLMGPDNDGDLARITVGTGLSLSGTTLNVSGVGTVTSIATNNGITGGTITSTGTVGLTGQALALHNASTNGLFARTGAGTVANRTITAGDGIAVTNGDGVSANPTITNVIASHGVLYNTGNLTAQTLDATEREIDFTQAINSNMTAVNTTTNVIEVPATGTYEISYSGSYQVASTYVSTLTFYAYINGADSGYYGSCRTRNAENGLNNLTNFSRTYITTLTAGDDIELYYDNGNAGITSTVSFFNLVLNVKRIK